MMTPDEAVAIASKEADEPVTGVMRLGDQGFVMGVHSEDPYASLPVYVDAHTGEARRLSPGEYVEIVNRLTAV